MALFNCAKVVNDADAHESPAFEATRRLVEKLITDLR